MNAALATEVPKRHAEWLEDRASSRSKGGSVLGAGLALIVVAALLDRMRYQRSAAVNVSAS